MTIAHNAEVEAIETQCPRCRSDIDYTEARATVFIRWKCGTNTMMLEESEPFCSHECYERQIQRLRSGLTKAVEDISWLLEDSRTSEVQAGWILDSSLREVFAELSALC